MSLRSIHAGACILLALAITLLTWGYLRVPIAITCLVCLALLVSAEAFRVRTDPLARKDDR
jgi:hypothetical protein